MSEFTDLLETTGLSKAGLARRLGVFGSTVSKWREDPPEYALAYLRLYREVQDLWERVA